MERKFLGWLFIIILCAQALSSLAHETFSTARDRGFGLSKQLMQEQEVNGVNGTTALDGESNGSRGYVLKKTKVFLRKGQKGKGSYGGANIVHHPRPNERSAAGAALLKRSPFFMISTGILYAGFGLVLVLF